MAATSVKPVRRVQGRGKRKTKSGASLPVRVAPILWLLLITGVLVVAAVFSMLAYQGQGVLLSTVDGSALFGSAVSLS